MAQWIVLLLSLTVLVSVDAHGSGKFTQDSECGKTKGCYSDCASGCSYEFTWKDEGTFVSFSLKADLETATLKWIAMGLSSDTSMGDDDVVECHRQASGDVKIYRSKNTGTFNAGPSSSAQTGLEQTSGSVVDNVMTCNFVLQKSAINLVNDYYMFYAHGEFRPSTTDMKSKHSTLPKISPQAVDLQSTANIGGTAVMILVKVHGSLMIAAWVLFASIGIVLARYYKPMWADQKLLGEKVWFQIHRSLMVLAVCCVIAAFVIIFVHAKGWREITGPDVSNFQKAHPYLGVIVTALAIINPTMAIFRPHPDGEYRYIFNWAHWIVGTGAHIIAVITIFIGVTLEAASAPEYTVYVLAAYVAYQFFIELLLELHDCFIGNKRKGRGTAYEMKKISEPEENNQATTNVKGAKFKKIIIGLHSLIIVGFTAAIIVIVVRN